MARLGAQGAGQVPSCWWTGYFDIGSAAGTGAILLVDLRGLVTVVEGRLLERSGHGANLPQRLERQASPNMPRVTTYALRSASPAKRINASSGQATRRGTSRAVARAEGCEKGFVMQRTASSRDLILGERVDNWAAPM